MVLTITITFLFAMASPSQAQTSEAGLARYIEESLRSTQANGPSPRSLYSANSYLAETARDPRAARVGDLVTINVAEQASTYLRKY
jgi:flagellar basal body L-ring protein FlgH